MIKQNISETWWDRAAFSSPSWDQH